MAQRKVQTSTWINVNFVDCVVVVFSNDEDRRGLCVKNFSFLIGKIYRVKFHCVRLGYRFSVGSFRDEWYRDSYVGFRWADVGSSWRSSLYMLRVVIYASTLRSRFLDLFYIFIIFWDLFYKNSWQNRNIIETVKIQQHYGCYLKADSMSTIFCSFRTRYEPHSNIISFYSSIKIIILLFRLLLISREHRY